MAVWMIFMPRSPVFLASKGDYEGARKALQWLRGGAKDVEEELEEIPFCNNEQSFIMLSLMINLFS